MVSGFPVASVKSRFASKLDEAVSKFVVVLLNTQVTFDRLTRTES